MKVTMRPAVQALSAILIWLASMPPRLAASEPLDFHFDSVRVEQSTLGSRRAGLLCLPQGSIRWRDIAASDKALTANLVKSIGEEVLGAGRTKGLRIEIVGLSVQSCAKRFGFGDSGVLSGTGKIEIDWAGPALATQIAHTASRFSFKQENAGSGGILSVAMRAAFADLQPELPTNRQ
ncbi:MAG: hypothetical protein J7494_06055 [Sphingobium sp.]|nr:hypothetical protein [Sphingobium sp.]